MGTPPRASSRAVAALARWQRRVEQQGHLMHPLEVCFALARQLDMMPLDGDPVAMATRLRDIRLGLEHLLGQLSHRDARALIDDCFGPYLATVDEAEAAFAEELAPVPDAVLADAVWRAGLAVLRYDDGQGDGVCAPAALWQSTALVAHAIGDAAAAQALWSWLGVTSTPAAGGLVERLAHVGRREDQRHLTWLELAHAPGWTPPPRLLRLAARAGAQVTDAELGSGDAARSGVHGRALEPTQFAAHAFIPAGAVPDGSDFLVSSSVIVHLGWPEPATLNPAATFHAPGGPVQLPALQLHVAARWGEREDKLLFEIDLGSHLLRLVVPRTADGFRAAERGLEPRDLAGALPSGGRLFLELPFAQLSRTMPATPLLRALAPALAVSSFGGLFQGVPLCFSDGGLAPGIDAAHTSLPPGAPAAGEGVLAVDRPFVFALLEGASRVPLALGRVTSPQVPARGRKATPVP